MSIENHNSKTITSDHLHKERCAELHHHRAENVGIKLRRKDYTFLWTFIRKS